MPSPPSPAGPLRVNRFVGRDYYLTKAFGENRWAIHCYDPIKGHELVTCRDLILSQPDHPCAGQWYYKLQLGRLGHKLPPIVSHRWR